MLRLLYFKVIEQHCIVLICGMITKISTFSKVRVAFNNAYRNMFGVYLSGVVPVRCMQTTISVTLKQL